MNAPDKILVIKLGALGDFIQALGPAAAIRNHHKDAEITLLTAKPFADFAQESGYFDRIWIDEKPAWFQLSAWRALRDKFRGENFSRVYDLQNNDRTALYFKLFGIDKPEWVGAVKGASHRNVSKERTAGHAFDGHVQTLALAGIMDIKIDRLEWLQGNISSFPIRKPYVLLIPGSAPNRMEKRWPAEEYTRLAKILSQWGYQPVILGTKTESGIASHIMQNSSDSLDLTGETSLAQVATLARGAAATIGNDTGPLHLVAATGCPCIALFSAQSNPVKHAPKGDHVQILQSKNLKDLQAEKVLQSFRPREEPPRNSTFLH